MEYSDLLIIAFASVTITVVGGIMLIREAVASLANARRKKKTELTGRVKSNKKFYVAESESVLS